MPELGKEREVQFWKYCKKCADWNEGKIDLKSPCDECLDTPVNEGTDRPIHFREVDE